MRTFHKSVKFWQEKVDLFESQNMTQTEFCIKNNLSLGAFSRWCKRFEYKNTQRKNSFVEVKAIQLPIVSSIQSYYDLIIKDKIKIRVNKYFDPELLNRIIKSLED